LPDLLKWLSGSIVAQALTTSPTLYLFLNAAHILSIGLLVGAILPLDLRLLGFFRRVPLAVLGPFLSRCAQTGAAFAIPTGIMLFTVRAGEYAGNPAFLAKIGILAVGITNAVLLHTTAPWQRVLAQGSAPASIRLMAALSLVTWIAAVVAGRWIGFV